MTKPSTGDDGPAGRGLPHGSLYASRWGLDPEVVFLNHGSFGACPREVLDVQAALRIGLESEPVRFFLREYPGRMVAARETLGRFVGAPADDLAFVANATTGVNALLAGLPLGPGDEVVVTDHEYPACRTAAGLLCRRAGASLRVAPLPFPARSGDELAEAVLSSLGTSTRVLLLDHVTSQTGMVLPVARIAAAAVGVSVIVDGAHAPGMLGLEVARLGVAGYAGNCHKWMCAPKGAGFLWAGPALRDRILPPVLSHGAGSSGDRFRDAFDWTGTQDPTAWLAVPAAVRVVGEMVDGGWAEVRRCNHELVVRARGVLCAALGVEPPCPEEMLGSMASLPLPDGSGPVDHLGVAPLQAELWDRFRIEVPVLSWPAPPRRLLRISAQLYNTLGQYEYLAEALVDCLNRE